MNIQLNGQTQQLQSSQSLKELIEFFCKQRKSIIAEVNGQIIRSPHWENTSLKDGDVVELVSFVGGG